MAGVGAGGRAAPGAGALGWEDLAGAGSVVGGGVDRGLVLADLTTAGGGATGCEAALGLGVFAAAARGGATDGDGGATAFAAVTVASTTGEASNGTAWATGVVGGVLSIGGSAGWGSCTAGGGTQAVAAGWASSQSIQPSQPAMGSNSTAAPTPSHSLRWRAARLAAGDAALSRFCAAWVEPEAPLPAGSRPGDGCGDVVGISASAKPGLGVEASALAGSAEGMGAARLISLRRRASSSTLTAASGRAGWHLMDMPPGRAWPAALHSGGVPTSGSRPPGWRRSPPWGAERSPVRSCRCRGFCI